MTDNGDGTFTYDPNGAFENLAVGETATDTFSLHHWSMVTAARIRRR